MSKVNNDNIYFCITLNPYSSQHFTCQTFLIIIIFFGIALIPCSSQRFTFKTLFLKLYYIVSLYVTSDLILYSSGLLSQNKSMFAKACFVLHEFVYI